jgi:hypothetical protein
MNWIVDVANWLGPDLISDLLFFAAGAAYASKKL